MRVGDVNEKETIKIHSHHNFMGSYGGQGSWVGTIYVCMYVCGLSTGVVAGRQVDFGSKTGPERRRRRVKDANG